MARRDQTDRSVRRDPDLREGTRDVRLNQNRRFYTPRGNDQAVRQARALQTALGVGVDFYEEHLERENVKGAQEATQDAAVGRRRMDGNKGYEETYQRIEAANDLAEMNRDLTRRLTEEGWEDLPQERVQAMIDGYFKEQLDGINPESVYGTLMAEGILKTNADLLDVHNANTLSRDQQERRTMLLNAARSQVETDGTLDYERLMEDTGVLLPGRGGRMTFMEILDTLASEMGRPDLLENAPTRFANGEPTGVEDPNFRRDFLNPAIARATAQQKRNETQQQKEYLEREQTARASRQASIDQRADAGDASVYHDIVAAGTAGEGEVPLFTEAQQRAAFNRLRNGMMAQAQEGNYLQLFASGNGQGLTANEYNRAALAYQQDAANRIRAENPDMDDAELRGAVLNATMERAIANDRLPTYITDMFKVSTRNPQRLSEAAEMRRYIEENSEGLVERHISDAHSARLDLYEQLMTETGDEEETIRLMEQHDPTRSHGRQKEITEYASDVLEELADDQKFWGSYPVRPQDQRRAEDMVKLYMEMGVPDEQIPVMVRDAFDARNTRVAGVMYPVDFGWVTGEPALDHWLNGASGDLWPDTANLIAEPHPHKRGVVVVRDADAFLPGGAEYSVVDIEEAYARSMSDQLIENVGDNTRTVSERYAEAEQRAANRMFDLGFTPEPGSMADFMDNPLVEFRALPEEDQRKAIEAELTRQ